MPFDGEDFLFHLYRGGELLQDNCVEEAKEELERALSLQPRDVVGQGLLGVVYFRLGMYPRAIEIYEEIIRARPEEVTPRVNLALCYLKTGQVLPARDLLEEVIRAMPDHRRAWGYLGLAFQRLADFSKAQAAFDRAEQPGLARRMQLLAEQASGAETGSADLSALRDAAAEAVRELDAAAQPPFLRAPNEPLTPSRSGLWRAIEPGQLAIVGQVPPMPPPVPVGKVEPPVVPEARPSLRVLAREAALSFPTSGASLDESGQVLVDVHGRFAARAGAVALMAAKKGRFGLSPLMRKSGGRELAEPLGGHAAPHVLLTGNGRLTLAPSAGQRAALLTLEDDALFVREGHLLGFDPTLLYESGRLQVGAAEHAVMVRLTGSGLVVVESAAPLAALPVTEDAPVVVRVDELLGYEGRLLPHPLPPEHVQCGLHGLVELCGEGTLFLGGHR
jgi:uncharacterized protein (AIM24 family)